MKHLRTYNLAVAFCRDIKTTQLPCHLKDQLARASSSIVLNLAEGTGRGTAKDQKRFFQISMGSTREVQAIMAIEFESFTPSQHTAIDHIAASLFKLIRNAGA